MSKFVRDLARLTILLLISILCAATLSGCATGPDTAAFDPLDDRSEDVVIMADGDGVGTSWSSISESALARTATELSNLGGAPVVLGAVGVMLVTDAAPRRRASRLSFGVNADIDPEALDADLAARIADALTPPGETMSEDAAIMGAAPDDIARDVRIKAIKRPRDLAGEGYVVETHYVLARDGRALRVDAHIVHADTRRLQKRIERELRRLNQSANSPGAQSNTRNSLRTLRRLQQELAALPPRYTGMLRYHSDPIDLPPLEAMKPDDPALQAMLLTALDRERDARRAAARQAFAATTDTAQPISARQMQRAERRRDKAMAKADRLHAKGLERARDAEIDKTENLIMALAQWRAPTPDGPSRLSVAIDDAHVFIADRVGAGLSGRPLPDALATARPTEPDNLAGGRRLQRAENGRMVLVVTEGPQAGWVLSLPESGAADYGGSVAQP